MVTKIQDLLGENLLSKSDDMTLRDYFAAKAMEAMIGKMGHYGRTFQTDGDFSLLCKDAYDMADAMLKEREKC
jgi:hypothetical protein